MYKEGKEHRSKRWPLHDSTFLDQDQEVPWVGDFNPRNGSSLARLKSQELQMSSNLCLSVTIQRLLLSFSKGVPKISQR